MHFPVVSVIGGGFDYSYKMRPNTAPQLRVWVV